MIRESDGFVFVVDSDLLISAVARLSREATGEMNASQLLRELCEVAQTALAVDGAGVMLSQHGANTFIHAVPDSVRPVEQLQEVLRSGPCARASTSGEAVIVEDLDGWRQWPEFIDAVRLLKIHAVVAVPLISRERCWGVLDLYRFEAGPWPAEQIRAAQVLANIAVSYLVMAADRDLARTALDQVVKLSRHDALTGLPNRAALFEQLEEALEDGLRTGGATAVIFVDLDRFKSINDTFGHHAGDLVLNEVALRLTAAMRDQDTVARLGGDEFVCICRNFRRSDHLLGDVTSAVGRIRNVFEEPVNLGAAPISVSASIGVSTAVGSADATEVLVDADQAMYAAKRQGRGSVSIRNQTHTDRTGYTRQMHRDLNDAMAKQELLVHYQPIVDGHTPHMVVAVEGLLRWQRPDGSILPAAAFIDSAASSGLIVGFGRWLVDNACGQMRSWIDELGEKAPQVVFLNFSAQELADPQLPTLMAQSLTRYRLLPARVGIEIVEENLADPDIAVRLRRFRSRGHPLSIDDFGTGYSSLSRLVDLPVDLIKIDRSFISGIPIDLRRVGVINAILAIADALNIRTIAEGVENEEQQTHLRQAGADLLQGYFISRPQSGDDISQRLRGQSEQK